MNYSSQAIIVDEDRNIYLERNSKIWSLSFIGGKVEEGENYESALLREIREELWIYLTVDKLLEWEVQPERAFPTGSWISRYFVVVLSESEKKSIENETIEVYDFDTLQRMDDSEFPIERVSFLTQVQRALDLL